MAVGKITLGALGGIEAGGILWDSVLRGFGARRQRTEDVHYLVRYRLAGRQHFHSLGRHGGADRHGQALTPDTARQEARRLLGLVAAKQNPKSEQVRQADTFLAEAERYLAKVKAARRPKTYAEVSRHLLVNAKPLHSSALADIDRRTIAQRLGVVEAASGATSRNRFRSSLSAFFSHCVKEGLLDASPVQGTAKAAESGPRERVLSDAELAEVWRALPSTGYGEAVRCLILTGQRREEIGQLTWSEVDFQRGLITLPATRTKNHRPHEVPMSGAVREIISRQPRRNSSEFVFGNGWGITDWSVSKGRLDAAIAECRQDPGRTRAEGARVRVSVGKAKPMQAWRLHDLRRTCATGMAELGTLPHIVEAALNHVSGHKRGVAGVYNHARYAAEVRDALERWTGHVAAITHR